MKRLISLLSAVIMIACVSVSKSRAYEEYNLSGIIGCSDIKSDSNSKGGYVCAFSGDTVFSARLVPDFSAYNFTVSGHIRGVSQSGKYTNALVFDDAFTNKYSVYSLDTDNGNVRKTSFNDENFRTDSFSVSDNCVYYIKTDSTYAYVACVDLSTGRKTKINFSQNANEIFNNNGKSYVRLYDGSVCRLSQASSACVANTGEFRNIANVGINKVINQDGFIVSLSDNSREYVSNAEFGKVSASDGKVFIVVNYRLSRKASDKTQSVSIPKAAKAVVAYKNRCGVLLDNGTVCVYEPSDFQEKKFINNNNNSNSNNNNNNNNNTSKDDNTTTPVEKEDKIYEGSAVCEPDEDEEFDAYKLTLEVVISADNKVKNIQNIKWSDRYMSAWYNMAQKTMVPKLISYGFEIPEKYDTVSGATCSSNALVKAYKDAISKINK